MAGSPKLANLALIPTPGAPSPCLASSVGDAPGEPGEPAKKRKRPSDAVPPLMVARATTLPRSLMAGLSLMGGLLNPEKVALAPTPGAVSSVLASFPEETACPAKNRNCAGPPVVVAR